MKIRKIKHHGQTRWRLHYRVGDIYRRRFFASRSDAQAFALDLLRQRNSLGEIWNEASTLQRVEMVTAWKRAQAGGYTLAEACQAAEAARARVEAVPTVADAMARLLERKGDVGLRPASLAKLRVHLTAFSAKFGKVRVPEVTGAAIHEWIHAQGWAPSTVKSSLGDILSLFRWCRRQGWLDRVPAVDLPRLELPPPCIHSPEEAGRLLAAAAAEDLSVCRFLALGYFAGLRPAEIARLREDNLARDWIEVPAVAAKTRTRRIVTANETLQAWLALGGSLPVRNLVRRLDRVREAAGVPWGHDVVRHTFASYHLAQHQSADRTAFELGHGSTQMLFRHYREAVTPEAAARFWALRPGITTAAGRTPP